MFIFKIKPEIKSYQENNTTAIMGASMRNQNCCYAVFKGQFSVKQYI